MTSKKIEDFADILNLPRPVSENHPPMSRTARAAQFSPFAALVGFDDEIAETGRLTAEQIELSEDKKHQLNEKLLIVNQNISLHPAITVTFFAADSRKAGGSYPQKTEAVKKIDTVTRKIVFMDGMEVAIDDVVEIDLGE